MRDGMPWMDTRVHADALENWQNKPGNRKRVLHLRRAVDEFDGRVDVVIVSGDPGVSYGTAQPWMDEGNRAGTFWKISNLDEATGHFEVALHRESVA
ncbi:hypothetical protein SAMN03159338_2819 [Sphingomonas sp. NFR04]|nr:hypothetical protein SAMN03159338_2819 [Sphingomonas sp. NFR04]